MRDKTNYLSIIASLNNHSNTLSTFDDVVFFFHEVEISVLIVSLFEKRNFNITETTTEVYRVEKFKEATVDLVQLKTVESFIHFLHR